MPYRKITTYEDAFTDVLGIKITKELKGFLSKMEQEGHTEKSISYAIFRSQNKLLSFKYDDRFINILRNEINKWSWRKGDPRWERYREKKSEEKKAEELTRFNGTNKRGNERSNGPKGFIYFIQGKSGGPIKIGYSQDPTTRLKELQSGHPDTLTILHLVPVSTKIYEAKFHKKYESYRLNGEWFKPDERLLKDIQTLKDSNKYIFN